MNMVLPDTGATLGPEWADLLKAALLSNVDSHDHSNGQGTKVRAAGLNIDSTVDFNFQAIIQLLYAGLFNNPNFSTVNGTLQAKDGDFYFRNHAGQNVQITNGGALAVTGAGAVSAKVIAAEPYTVLTTDAQSVLLVDTSAGARTINLLTAGTTSMWFGIKDIGGEAGTNPITINVNTPATERIDKDSTSFVMDTDFMEVNLVNDAGSNWYIV
jgi:hypothetical protein